MIELADLLQATGGTVHGTVEATCFTGFCHDSRQAVPGQLFVAVRTDWADGHDYVADACRAGVKGILCEQPPAPGVAPVTCVVVQDTQAALADWARFALRRQAVEVVGVTGSAGKTTAKEAIALVLGRRQPVFRSPANYSGRFGLPIGLGELLPEHRLAVLEMACDSPGEMADLVRIAAPRHGVVLNVSQAHLESLGSLEGVAAEKGRLVECLPSDGWAVLNCDDPLVAAMADRTTAGVLRIGLGPAAEVRAVDVEAEEAGLSFTVTAGGGRLRVRCGLFGKHNVHAALAAVAMGIIYGLDLDEVAQALEGMQPLPGRLRPLRGRGGSLVLDDTYSSIPAGVAAALDALAGLRRRPAIVVLGDMAELGQEEEQAHREAGRRAANVADLLVTCGERMRLAAAEARRCGLPAERVRVTYTAEDALRAVEEATEPGAAILVKGSAESRLEAVVRGLVEDPAGAERWLVRQGPAWQAVRRKRPTRPTWVEIDLEAIAHNVRELCAIVGPKVRLMAVLKADGYGHGAVKVARTALNNGASWLGVACLSEGLALRQAGLDAPILILGYTPPWQAREVVEQGIDAAVFTLDTARALCRAAGEVGRPARVHVKVDTGMGRLGLLPDEVREFVRLLRSLPGIAVEGLFTHFATADSADGHYAQQQLDRFRKVIGALEEEGLRPPIVHAANSAAALAMPGARFDMVRVGIALFGLNPSQQVPCPDGFRPALTFRTQVAQVKRLPAGSYVSYGCTYCTPRDSLIAVIPVGYADGFRRAPQHWGEVLVRGQRASIVGRVCMDQTMIDVTDVPGVRQGDEVVLIGAQGRERITVDDVAARLGTINYEVVSEILARVPRVS
ncbi:MAG: alanine racemase [Anaerolineae bacterium]|nr:alanine racemase [Anaerolineae bacterium]